MGKNIEGFMEKEDLDALSQKGDKAVERLKKKIRWFEFRERYFIWRNW